jgi:hypothetical protein
MASNGCAAQHSGQKVLTLEVIYQKRYTVMHTLHHVDAQVNKLLLYAIGARWRSRSQTMSEERLNAWIATSGQSKMILTGVR